MCDFLPDGHCPYKRANSAFQSLMKRVKSFMSGKSKDAEFNSNKLAIEEPVEKRG